MNAIIAYRPERMAYDIFLEGGGLSFFRSGEGELMVQVFKRGEEMLPFLTLSEEEYRAISQAVVEHERPQLADHRLLSDVLEHERERSDRLLTLVERGWDG